MALRRGVIRQLIKKQTEAARNTIVQTEIGMFTSDGNTTLTKRVTPGTLRGFLGQRVVIDDANGNICDENDDSVGVVNYISGHVWINHANDSQYTFCYCPA